MPQSAWSMIERGKKRPSLDQAFQIQLVTDGVIMARTWADPKKLGAVQPILRIRRRRPRRRAASVLRPTRRHPDGALGTGALIASPHRISI
jgi:hypothetical protein